LNKISYLGPLRKYPPRHIAFGEVDFDVSKGLTAELAWLLLLHNDIVRGKVNNWLQKEHIKTPYEITIVDYAPIQAIKPHLAMELSKLDFQIEERDDEWKDVAEKYVEGGCGKVHQDGILSDRDIEILEDAYIDLQIDTGELYESKENYKLMISLLKDLIKKIEKQPNKALDILNSIISKEKANLSNNKEIDSPLKIYRQILEKGDIAQFITHIKMDIEDLKKEADAIKIETPIDYVDVSASELLGLKYNYNAEVSNPDYEAEKILSRIGRSDIPKEPDLMLIDKRTNTSVSFRDIGIGISQIIPVLVYAYSVKNRLIAIEEPEVSIHPALQAELGDLFIESALGNNKNTFLIETHSEHLILRILRRIRETFEASQQKAPPKIENPITPDDVSVIYAKPTKEGTKLYVMEITEDGNFEKDWPDGFFEERLEEFR